MYTEQSLHTLGVSSWAKTTYEKNGAVWLVENILVTRSGASVADAYRTVAKRCGGNVVGEASGKASRIVWTNSTDRRIMILEERSVISLESTDQSVTEQRLNDLASEAQRRAASLA